MPDYVGNPPILERQAPALKLVGELFFLFTLFPAVSVLPLPIQTDTQPNALFAAFFIFLVGRRVPLPRTVWMLLVLFTGALVLFLTGGISIDGVRSLLGYTTVFIVAVATLVLDASNIRLPNKLLDYSVYIWMFVGTVQLTLSHSFMTFLVARNITTETRGVTSLSNEPSLYATTLIFIIMLYFIRKRELSFPVFLCLIQIVLFSQSVLGALFVMMMLGLYALIRLSAPAAIIALAALGSVLFILFMYGGVLLPGSRIGGLLAILKDTPLLILKLDVSVSQRLASIFYSIKGAVDSIFVPHGFNAWKGYSHAQGFIYQGVFGSDLPMDRIMSGYGSALFEMGWIGLTVPVVITVGAIKSLWPDDKARTIAFLIVVHLLLVMPVPLTFPLVGLLIGELFSRVPTLSSPALPV